MSLASHYIEGGWPGSNPKDVEFFRRAAAMAWKQAKISAFGSTRRKDSDRRQTTPTSSALLEAETPVVTLVGKSWDLHVSDVLETDYGRKPGHDWRKRGLLQEAGREVIYDAEHFFDGYKANPEYAVATVQARRSTAPTASCYATPTAARCPGKWKRSCAKCASAWAQCRMGIHTHDDAGVAVANTLAAVRAGAVQSGHDQRLRRTRGQRQLCTIIPDLQLKMGTAACLDRRSSRS